MPNDLIRRHWRHDRINELQREKASPTIGAFYKRCVLMPLQYKNVDTITWLDNCVLHPKWIDDLWFCMKSQDRVVPLAPSAPFHGSGVRGGWSGGGAVSTPSSISSSSPSSPLSILLLSALLASLLALFLCFLAAKWSWRRFLPANELSTECHAIQHEAESPS